MCSISHGETAKLLYRWRFLFACAGWLLPELAVTVRGWQTIYSCVLGKPFDEMRLQSSSFRDPFCYQNCLGWRATMNLFIPICMISLHIWFISQPITVNIYKYSSTCLQSHLASIIAGSMEKTLRGQNKGTAANHRCRDLSRVILACASTAYLRHGRVQKLVSVVAFLIPGASIGGTRRERWVPLRQAPPNKSSWISQPVPAQFPRKRPLNFFSLVFSMIPQKETYTSHRQQRVHRDSRRTYQWRKRVTRTSHLFSPRVLVLNMHR